MGIISYPLIIQHFGGRGGAGVGAAGAHRLKGAALGEQVREIIWASQLVALVGAPASDGAALGQNARMSRKFLIVRSGREIIGIKPPASDLNMQGRVRRGDVRGGGVQIVIPVRVDLSTHVAAPTIGLMILVDGAGMGPGDIHREHILQSGDRHWRAAQVEVATIAELAVGVVAKTVDLTVGLDRAG